jgi:branched-subunit amino acid transport protein
MAIWVMIGLAALASNGERSLFGLLPASWQLPQRVRDALDFLPVSAFAALAFPGLLPTAAPLPSLSASKLLAAFVAAYVAWLSRGWGIKGLPFVLLVGMGVYWLDVWVS